MMRDSGLTDETARRVLQRAAQLDATTRLNVSVADLRAAAVAAGISEHALDQALAELGAQQREASDDVAVFIDGASGDVVTAASPANRRSRQIRTAVFIVAAAIAGFVTGATLVHRELFPGPQPDFMRLEPVMDVPERTAPIGVEPIR